jgi:hypothetical protein
VNKPDEALGQLSDTMKTLMAPRVELTREQYEALQARSKKSKKSVKEIVRLALDRYLKDAASRE